ncbi:MAG: UDP-N-acetylmuramoyl-tripeptide--D-alanyl-D-alanine ligase [Acidiferrobacterales bacterium]
MSLSLAADVLQSQFSGRDRVFHGVGTDTRSLEKGDLFFALRGPNFDGNLFLAEALGAGAVGAVVSRDIDTALPIIQVEDTRVALGSMASFWRQQFDFPVIAVTGSNGKTTVKNMIASILSQSAKGWATAGNLNNDIGVPLTLLKLRQQHKFAVVEMGMNHPGEIAYLSGLARPTVAVITNAAHAHLEGLGTVEQVARCKGEIFGGLSDDGVAVINADDPYHRLWRDLAGTRQVMTFALENSADVTAEYQIAECGSLVCIKTKEGDIEMSLPLLGKHNVMNAVTAATTALAGGSGLGDIRRGLEKLTAIAGRLEIKTGINGARILDDTYNANPDSVGAGLEVLREANGEKVLVLGDMAELGDASEAIHRRVGELARRVGVHRLFAVGKLGRHAAAAFGKGGRHLENHEEVIDALLDVLHSDMTVLVKGSRSMQMEKVVTGIARSDKN